VAADSTNLKGLKGDMIAAIALRTPNHDPEAIPVPESIAFLHGLPRRPCQELGPCPVCLENFTTCGPGSGMNIFEELTEGPEAACVLPCRHTIGSNCLRILFSPFGTAQANSCPLCRRECFAKQDISYNPRGIDRGLHLIAWSIQECQRMLLECSEKRKQDVSDTIAMMERHREKLERYKAEMQTGRSRLISMVVDVINQELEQGDFEVMMSDAVVLGSPRITYEDVVRVLEIAQMVSSEEIEREGETTRGEEITSEEETTNQEMWLTSLDLEEIRRRLSRITTATIDQLLRQGQRRE